MRLHIFTRKLAECRKRWNQGSLRFVLEASKILRKARVEAQTKRRWGRWIDEETSMSRSTVYRYMRVEALIKANVSRMAHFENLGLNKIFALLTLKQADLLKILKGRVLFRLTDIQLRTFLRRFRPRQDSMITTPNLIRTLDASLRRLDSALQRWKSCRQPLPSQIRARLVSKLRRVIRETCQDSRMAV